MIYTFYSYKGGVGRSMALANVAEWFYEQGLRVVMIDWDLEAPGLESFFVSQDLIEKVRAKPGLLDMLLSYKDQYSQLPLTASSPAVAAAAAGGGIVAAATRFANSGKTESLSQSGAETFESEQEARSLPKAAAKLDTLSAVEVLGKYLPPLEHFLYPIRPPATNGKKGALWLLSAGWRSRERFAEYGRAVQNFSWSELYDAYHGEAYFEWMRKQLTSESLADVVLIDSRTGLTEMGGVCTRQLADVVVSFTAPNVQNLNGVISLMASFKKEEVADARNDLEPGGAKRPLEVVIVPTRIDNSETKLRNNFREEFTGKLTDYPASFRILKKTFWDLLIPYIPTYAYSEKLAIGDEEGGAEDLQKAYKNLAAHLVLLAPEGGPIRASFGAELRERFGTMLPRILLADDGGDASGLRNQLTTAGLSLWDPAGGDSDGHGSTQQLTGNIDLAEFLLLPVTSQGARSETFFKQWRYARQQGVCVQLVRGNPEAELIEDELPLWLRAAHIYDPEREIDELIQVLRRPCITSRIPYMEPKLPDSHVARPMEIEQLVTALLNSKPEGGASAVNAAAIRVALCGPPGSGKTVVATAACIDERIIAAYSDGILWVNCGDLPNFSAELSLLYAALTGEHKPTPPTGIERMVAAKLEGKKCLLVVNDVCRAADLQPFLEAFPGGAFLFTSRNQNLAAEFGATKVLIGEMSSAQSVDLLCKQSGIPSGHEAALSRVVEAMGKVPLPIKLVATTLKQRLALGDKPDEVLTSIHHEIEASGVVAFDQKDASERDHSVAKSITASLSHMSELERDAFLKLSALPAGADTPLTELGQLWEQNEAESQKLAQQFASLSLLDYDPVKRTLRVGRLVHSFLTAQRADPSILNQKIEKAESTFAGLTPEEQLSAQRVLTRLVRLADPEGRLPDTRRSYDLSRFETAARLIVETLQLAEIVVVETGASPDSSTVQIADDSIVQGWNRLRAWLEADRSFLIWRQTLEPAVIEWESSKRHNREVLLTGKELAEARTWLSTRKDDLNSSEGLFVSESERAEVHRKVEKSRTLGRAAVVSVVVATLLVGAVYYSDYRRQQIAAVQKEQSLRALSNTRIDQPIDALLEPHDEASYRRVIDAYTEVISENSQFAEAYDGRGSAYLGLGEYDKAESDFKQAVTLAPNYAEAYKNWGTVLKLKGDRSVPEQAVDFYGQAISAFGHAISLRPNYPEAYFSRGDTYTSKGDKTGDKASYDLAIADYTKIIAQLERDKPTADVYYKRGLAYKSKGDNTNALVDFQKASELPGDDVTRENIKRNLQQLNAIGPPVLTPATPTIFIQYNDPDDKEVIERVAEDLKFRKFKVVGRPQLSSATVPGDGDVRCFHTNDFKNAEQIATAVQDSLGIKNYDKTIKARDLDGYPNVPPGQIEVWIASLRIASTRVTPTQTTR
jgi:tetratricopeptide (TPR) repeat protein